jgi:hypothetical protein
MSAADVEKASVEPTNDVSLSATHADIAGNPKENEPVDENVVWWDEPVDQDPLNAMNWSEKKKWANIAVLSAMTFVT